METNERPIDLRHLQLAMMYFTKCHANDSNPARQSTENESHDVRFALRHRFIRPLRHRVQDHLENASIDIQIIHSALNPLSPPPPPPPLHDSYEPPRYRQPPFWRLHLPKVDLTLATFTKQSTNSDNFRMEFILRKMHYSGATCIYTDGSKCHEKNSLVVLFQ